jgi:mannitol operon transcriptional antiterminator
MVLAGISPRLARLLELLAETKKPVRIDALAASLETSRRTVFRELENAGSVLSSFQAKLAAVPGKGIAFSGSGESREKLLTALREYARAPGSRRERLLRLVVEILANAGIIQKLFFYAGILKVSESTVSNDLDDLEEWFTARGIRLIRKGGLGVLAEGSEEAIRVAMVSRLLTDGDTGGKSYTAAFGYPGEHYELGIREVLRRTGDKLAWMTSESYTMISLYLMVMIQRICAEKVINGEWREKNHRGENFQMHLAELISGEVAAVFSVNLTRLETEALAAQIGACRAKQITPVETGFLEQQELIQTLTYRMIERFDPPIAAILKTNDELVRFLARHLGSALIRLRENMDHPNPMETELISHYPEVYQKTHRAVTALEEYLGFPVPVSEITFIEIHFLAALASLGEKNIRKRFLRAGIVCVSGIGVSYMLASQIRRRFFDELELEISGWDEKDAWKNNDFLISTIQLENAEKPVVLVSTILKEDDYSRIQNAINTYAFVERGAAPRNTGNSLTRDLEALEMIFALTRTLLDGFTLEHIRGDCCFDELARFASSRFARGSEEVYKALLSREKTASQVITDLGIVLLHTRCPAVTVPVFGIVMPAGKKFASNYFKGAKSCIIMLLPEDAPPEMYRLMGGISSALVDVPAFLDAVRDGNEQAVKALLEAEISDALARCCKEKLRTIARQ